jgi:hypothetical protein
MSEWAVPSAAHILVLQFGLSLPPASMPDWMSVSLNAESLPPPLELLSFLAVFGS